MSNLEVPFYNIEKPEIGEIVLVKFSKKFDETNHFEGDLMEYNCRLYMNFSDATKKRRTNFNKIVKIGDEVFASVDEIMDGNIIKVSLRDVSVDKDENPFEDNKTLIKIFKDLSRKHNKNINELWSSIIYKIDEKRRENEFESSILKYIMEKKEEIKTDFNDDDLYNNFFQLIDKINEEKPHKIISKIEIVSTGCISNTITVIKNCLENIKFKYTLKYDAAPVYILESMSIDSSIKEHDIFIELLKVEGQKMNPKTFIKCERK